MGTQWPILPFPGDRDLVLALVPAWIRGGGECAPLSVSSAGPPPPRQGEGWEAVSGRSPRLFIFLNRDRPRQTPTPPISSPPVGTPSLLSVFTVWLL